MEDSKMNLVCLACAIGQLNPEASVFPYTAESIVNYVNAFDSWEANNVLCLPNGWEDYMDNGGKDYESVIYEWAKDFAI